MSWIYKTLLVQRIETSQRMKFQKSNPKKQTISNLEILMSQIIWDVVKLGRSEKNNFKKAHPCLFYHPWEGLNPKPQPTISQ